MTNNNSSMEPVKPIEAKPAAIIRLSMWDAKAFELDILPQPASSFATTLAKVHGLPEKRYHTRQGTYRVPCSAFNIKYLLENFANGEIEADADAVVVMRHTALTERSAELREKRRWQYLFEDAVPEWDWLANGSGAIKPYRHQIVAADAMRGTEFFGLLMEQGTGKTLAVTEELHQMVRERRESDPVDERPIKVLVVCPTSLCGNWIRELKKGQSGEYTGWYKRMRRHANGVADLVEGLRADADMKVWVVNYERVKTNLVPLVKMEFDLVVYDESNAAKNPSAKRTKACMDLSKSARRRIIMTGTIMANTVLDVWAQFELLSPGCLGYSSFAQFKRAYVHVKKVKKWDKVIGYRDLDQLKARMAKFSFIVKKEQCLDLPPKVYETVSVEMADKQADMYEQMLEMCVASLGAEATEFNSVQATAAIAQILRLTQITSGHIRVSAGSVVQIPGGNPKMDALLEIVDAAEGKVIVWARFREDIRAIAEHLAANGIKSVQMHGGVSSSPDKHGVSERDRVVEEFNSSNDTKVFIGESGTGGVGLTLLGPDDDRCSTMIYYSHDWSLMKREQSEDRAHRIGQDRKLTIYDLVCEGTIDEAIVAALRAKKNLAETLKDVSTIKDFLLRGRSPRPPTKGKQAISDLRHILSSRGIRIPIEPNSQPGCAEFDHESSPTCPHCNGDPMSTPVEYLRRFFTENNRMVDLDRGDIIDIKDA